MTWRSATERVRGREREEASKARRQRGSEAELEKKLVKLGCCAEEDSEVSDREGQRQPERER
eukprot:1827743-Rhodomonas_salina.1